MSELLSDEALVAGAAGAARAVSAGETVPESTISLLRAVASTRDEQRRHELAAQSAALAGELVPVALTFLRVAIFAIA